jgi:hypothetical protein
MSVGKIFLTLKIVAAVVGILLIIGLGIKSSRVMPDHAVVYANDGSKTYLAPPCIKATAGLRLITAGEAHRLGYEPDRKCRDKGAFVQDDRSLTGIFFQNIGLVNPKMSRWNEDGSWNY